MRIFPSVGASVFAGGLCLGSLLGVFDRVFLRISAYFCGFLVARDIAEKTLTSINENQNQNRKLNRPG